MTSVEDNQACLFSILIFVHVEFTKKPCSTAATRAGVGLATEDSVHPALRRRERQPGHEDRAKGVQGMRQHPKKESGLLETKSGTEAHGPSPFSKQRRCCYNI